MMNELWVNYKFELWGLMILFFTIVVVCVPRIYNKLEKKRKESKSKLKKVREEEWIKKMILKY